MRYEVKYTTQFKRELEQAQKQHKNLDKLFYVINLLAAGRTLEPKYKDHNLAGRYRHARECHIEPDWLLIYER